MICSGAYNRNIKLQGEPSMKKLLCMILSILLFSVSCSKDTAQQADQSDKNDSANLFTPSVIEFSPEELPASENLTSDSEQVTDESDPDAPLTLKDLDVAAIYSFNDDRALFITKNTYSSVIDPETSACRMGKYGYVDPMGNVIVEPIYTYLPSHCEFPVFAEYDERINGETRSYITYIHPENSNFYFDFTDEMDEFADAASNGLFWVRSVEQNLSGNVYTMTYYDENGTAVFSIENATQMQDGQSDFNENGYALVSIDGIGRMIDRNGNIIELIHDNGNKITHKPYFGTYTYEGTISEVNLKEIYGDTILAEISYTYQEYGSDRTAEKDFFLKVDYSQYTYTICNGDINSPGIMDYISDNYIYQKIGHESYTAETMELLCEFETLPAFEGAKIVEYSAPSEDILCFVLQNKDNVRFATAVDLAGNILMQPTTAISFPKNQSGTKYSLFCRFTDGLCPAKDNESGLYGYIDATGAWKIAPQFESVNNFRSGYAHVNINENSDSLHGTIIDTNGNILFKY